MPGDDSDVIREIMTSHQQLPPSFEDNNVVMLFKSIERQVTDINESYKELLIKMVGWDKCANLRSTCQHDVNNKFSDVFTRLKSIEVQLPTVATGPDLAQAERDYRESDEKILKEIQKINSKLVIFEFSWCSANWLWSHKKGATGFIIVASAWLYLIDCFARWSQWSLFPPIQ
jgi:hypothetical protein